MGSNNPKEEETFVLPFVKEEDIRGAREIIKSKENPGVGTFVILGRGGADGINRD